MKKLFVYGCVAVLGAASLVSCKKDYTCDYGDGDVVTYSKLGKTQAAAAKTTCTTYGGTWSKK